MLLTGASNTTSHVLGQHSTESCDSLLLEWPLGSFKQKGHEVHTTHFRAIKITQWDSQKEENQLLHKHTNYVSFPTPTNLKNLQQNRNIQGHEDEGGGKIRLIRQTTVEKSKRRACSPVPIYTCKHESFYYTGPLSLSVVSFFVLTLLRQGLM